MRDEVKLALLRSGLPGKLRSAMARGRRALTVSKRAVKDLGMAALTRPEIYGRLRMQALQNDPITILCYHTLGPDTDQMDAWTVLRLRDFRAQIDMLRRDYDIVSLDQALDGPGDRPQAVLTFDDGDPGLFRHLLPIVQAEALPVTLYVATGQIADRQAYWFDRIMNALQSEGQRRINLNEEGLGAWNIGPARGAARWQVISDLLERLKTLPPHQREALTDRIVVQAAPVTLPKQPVGPMRLSQLHQIASEPLFTIGAHSHCHDLLDQIPLDQAAASITQSRELLQDWTDREIRHFAYPNGNHNAALQAELTRQGFRSATVLDNALTPRGAPPMALSRIGVGRYDSLARLRLRMVGR